METLETIAEEIAKDRVTEAGETFQKAGWLIEKIVLPFTEFVINNLWMLLVLLICAAICTAIIKRKK